MKLSQKTRRYHERILFYLDKRNVKDMNKNPEAKKEKVINASVIK